MIDSWWLFRLFGRSITAAVTSTGYPVVPMLFYAALDNKTEASMFGLSIVDFGQIIFDKLEFGSAIGAPFCKKSEFRVTSINIHSERTQPFTHKIQKAILINVLNSHK